ncbi:hypothetical protein RHSIM_Rhsim13G0004700 [Rhododendron simsii]|uniref:WRKY domain-containing protein n=1 Tax=Rhododendron simsii TaxID=118357 RepID=A0A834G722_RHOSS|nr:hypothetical protein RHSIM_Rhsim13G0004700 [Rhododendron simsii]
MSSSVMDGSLSEGLDSTPEERKELEAETQASKRRQVCCCNDWCRGYYRCSTSKGCSAKKQVERCRTDASMLIITYTSTHNHPGPDPIPTTEKPQNQPTKDHQPTTPKEEEEEEEEEEEQQQQPPPPPPAEKEQEPPQDSQEEDANEDHFHYSQSPFNNSQDIIIMGKRENPFDDHQEPISTVLLEEEPLISFPPLLSFSSDQLKSEENDHDFYDELEELPSSSSSSSSFTSSFLRTSNFFDDRILVYPS